MAVLWRGSREEFIRRLAHTEQPMMDAKLCRLLICALCAAFLLSPLACSQRTTTRETDARANDPRHGGTLIVPIFGSAITRARLDPIVPSYDPIASMIFDRLAVAEDPTGARVGLALAETWEESPDGLVWRFYLREARFQDDECFPNGIGRRVRADDVIYSWQRMIRALPAGYHYFGRFIAGASEYRDGRAEAISGLRALDDRTLEVRLITPFFGFIRAVTWFPTSIVPREAVERYGEDFAKHPVGTGAFRLVEWDVNGGRITLARNPNYWGRDPQGRQLPYLDEIRYVLYPNQMTAFQAVVNGEAHMAPVPADLLDGVATRDSSGELRLRDEYAARNLRLVPYQPPIFGAYACFNLDRKTPFAREVRLRQAIGYVLRLPSEPPMRPLLRPVFGVPSQDDKGFYYDPERARALLREAGHPKGRKLPKLRLVTTPYNREQNFERIERIKELGIPLEENLVNSVEIEQRLREGDFDLYMSTWEWFYPDAAALLMRFLSDAPPEENIARYRNPDFDALFMRMIGERDETKRGLLVGEMEELLLRSAVWITFRISSPDRQYVIIRNDARFHDSARERINFRTTWLD
ncbi:MAG: hypothetical protein C4334_05745 [Pyrinomonas sp.]